MGQQGSFGRSQPKSTPLDPSSGSFYVQKPKFGYAEDKENIGHGMENSYDMDMPARPFRRDQMGSQGTSYLEIGNSSSRDASIPPSRGSDAGLNTNGLQFSNRNPSLSSFGHTSNSSIHSQRPSVSGLSGGYVSQTNGSRYAEQTEAELRAKFSGFSLGEVDANLSQGNGASYSPSQTASYTQGYAGNGGPHNWIDASNFAKVSNNYESFANQPFADQAYFNKPRFERSSVSPAGSDYRRGLNSPKFYTSGTPPAEVFRPNSRGPRPPQDPVDLNRRLQNMQFAQHQNYYHQYPGQYPPAAYEYPQHFRQPAVPYHYMPVPVPAFPPAQIIPTRPAKDHDVGVGVRSILLEEFRSNSKSNKRYELKDIYQHVVEFSGDQHGSRFIQQKLETANSDEKEQLFREIQPNALQLMTDVFGNYVIQKMFEHGNQVQKRLLAEQMKNHVMELSMQMYGCRVVQKALEHVLADQQAELVAELQADVLKCIKDQNGNHVVQKAIERVPTEHIQFVIEAFRGQVNQLATHPYGCRVIQRILEYCKPHDQLYILEELHQCSSLLITDQYGNYVTQHIIQHGKPEDRTKVIRIVQSQLLTLSKHKFASNVVEKSIQFGTEEQRKSIVAQLITPDEEGVNPLQLMMKDQYGNYVIRKSLKLVAPFLLTSTQKSCLVNLKVPNVMLSWKK
jgi:mRNA-binding protein PUF3